MINILFIGFKTNHILLVGIGVRILSSIIALMVNKIIEFIERDYMEEEVRIEIISGPKKVFSHEGFIELSRGAEYALPRWVSEILVNEKYARYREEGFDVEKLSSIAYNEESAVKKLQLMKIPRYFYMMIKKDIEDLLKKLESSGNIALLEEYKQREDLYYTIGRIRVRKILNFLLLPSIPQEIADKMSEEEKLLYIVLKDSLSSWMKSLGLEKTS